MLRLAITLLLISLVLALFGFGVVASGFAEIAKILFFVFIALFLISAIAGALRGRGPAV